MLAETRVALALLTAGFPRIEFVTAPVTVTDTVRALIWPVALIAIRQVRAPSLRPCLMLVVAAFSRRGGCILAETRVALAFIIAALERIVFCAARRASANGRRALVWPFTLTAISQVRAPEISNTMTVGAAFSSPIYCIVAVWRVTLVVSTAGLVQIVLGTALFATTEICPSALLIPVALIAGWQVRAPKLGPVLIAGAAAFSVPANCIMAVRRVTLSIITTGFVQIEFWAALFATTNKTTALVWPITLTAINQVRAPEISKTMTVGTAFSLPIYCIVAVWRVTLAVSTAGLVQIVLGTALIIVTEGRASALVWPVALIASRQVRAPMVPTKCSNAVGAAFVVTVCCDMAVGGVTMIPLLAGFVRIFFGAAVARRFVLT
jgi:hypothetical protein